MSNAASPPLDDHTSSSTSDDLPNVLLDRVQLAFSASLPLSITQARAFCAALHRNGVIARKPPRGREVGAKLVLAEIVVPLPSGGEARPDGFLILGEQSGYLTIRPTSHLLPNVMRALRTTLAEPLAPAVRGGDNLACHYDANTVQDLVGRQLAAVTAVVDALVASLAAAYPASAHASATLLVNVWVQQAEFCRDYEVADAVAFVEDMAERPIPGAGRAQRTHHQNSLTLAWHEGTKTAPERKVYAKRPDTVRVEIALRNRPAVRRLLTSVCTGHADGARLDAAGVAVAETLRRLGAAAAPLLDNLVVFANEVQDVPPRVGAELMVAFVPLLRLVAPVPRPPGAGGRQAGPGVARLARKALDALIVHGRFDMRGAGASDGVLMALREMATSGALRVAAERPRLFAVAPAFEAARQALANVREWPNEDRELAEASE